MIRQFVMYMISCVSFLGAVAQSFDSDKLDKYFDALERHNKFMGSVALSKDGQLIYKRSVGYSDYENRIKANENSKYRIGSISKTFTAVLIMKGVEDKKINLNQTIDLYFPTIKNADHITIEQLLYHSSGINSFTDEDDYLTWNAHPKTVNEMIAIITSAKPNFEPGSKTEYSNSNYYLLSIILEKEYKKSYGELIDDFIAKPIALSNTFLGSKIDPAKNQCKSYVYNGDWVASSETDMSIPLGAGSIVSTPLDLNKFSYALFHGKLLKPESLSKMKEIKNNYGMGLIQMPFDQNIGYGHTGGIDEFSSAFSYFESGDICLAMVSNGTNYNNNEIAINLLNAVFGLPYEIPEFSSYQVLSTDLDQYIGVYASDQIPLEITISKDGDQLVAQGTDQPSLPLEATSKNIFKNDRVGVELEFSPSEGFFDLKQGGNLLRFKKK